MSCGNEFHMWCSFFQFSLNQFWMLWGFVFTSSTRFGTLGPFLQSPFIWHRVLFQNIIVIYIQGIFMDHVLVSQRYLGTTMRNHLVSRTDVRKKDMKDWYQKLCEMTWNSNHHGSDIKTFPERLKPFSCTQHFFFSLMKKYLYPYDTEFLNCILRKTVVDLDWFFLPALDWLHDTKFFPHPITKEGNVVLKW